MYNILWDFDGTIAYRDGMWSGTLFSLLGKNCIKNIPVENIKPYLNKGFTWHTPEYSHKELFNGKTWNEYYENYFYTIFTKLGIEENIAEQLSKNVIIEYMDKTKWNIYDDVIKALEETIEKGHRNYILSNHVPGLNKIVENIGIQKYFNGIYSSGNIGYEKPNIKFYKKILNETKLDKKNCIIIGDSYDSDIKGGEGIGIKSILVRTENKNDYKWYCKGLENIIGKIKNVMK